MSCRRDCLSMRHEYLLIRMAWIYSSLTTYNSLIPRRPTVESRNWPKLLDTSNDFRENYESLSWLCLNCLDKQKCTMGSHACLTSESLVRLKTTLTKL